MSTIPNPTAFDIEQIRALVDGPSEMDLLRLELGQTRFALDVTQARVDAIAAEGDEWRGRFALALMIPAVVILVAAWGWIWGWISQ